MQTEGRGESENVEDDRSSGGGGGRGVGLAMGGVGSIVVVVIALLLGIDPRQLGNPPGQGGGQPAAGPQQPPDPAEEQVAHFTKVIFGDTERIWGEIFRQRNANYPKPVLHLFTGQVNTACGGANAQVGPFYCPADSKVYIDLDFYRTMDVKLHATGDFARAYVVAHEVGHHVQKQLFPKDVAQVDQARQRGDPKQANRMSVRLELQADYLAGVWAHWGQQKYKFLDPGDLEKALNAASQIGDDKLQKQARGTVMPDSFTHGTSAQRVKWFKQGFDTGDVDGAAEIFTLPYERL